MDRRVFVGVYPFAQADPEPRLALERARCEVRANPHPRKLREEEVVALIGDATGYVAGTEPITARVLDAAPTLRVIARVGVGLDSVDLEAARARGIAVAYTPEAPAWSVVELTLGLLVDLARDVSRVDRAMRDGRWDRRTGFLLRGKTLGILGCGRIGRRVARLARELGMRVIAHDIVRDATLGITYVPLDELLAHSDALTIHVPLTPATRGMISEEALARLKPGAVLVNTSRGEVIDEAALERALTTGHLRGAALDVFHQEPYAGSLARLENVILTAHVGSCTVEGRRAMELGAAQAVIAFFEGREVPDRLV